MLVTLLLLVFRASCATATCVPQQERRSPLPLYGPAINVTRDVIGVAAQLEREMHAHRFGFVVGSHKSGAIGEVYL